ncbi:hypothetical protein LCGC14_1601800, partial [marine sediment metagenome]
MKRARIALKVFILPSIVFAGLLWAIVWANGSKKPIDKGKICPTCRPYQRSNRIKEGSLYCEQCYNEYEEKERKQNWLDSEANARFHARIAMRKRFENRVPDPNLACSDEEPNEVNICPLCTHRLFLEMKACSSG